MILPNGLEIYFTIEPYNISRIELVVKSGMLVETDKEHGYAHLLEHLASFYPSKRYPDSLKNQQFFTESEIECNAWTSPFSTGYYLQGVSKLLYKMIEYMYHHLKEPVWDSSIFPQEKKAVIQELTNHKTAIWNNLTELINRHDFPNTIFEYGLGHEIENIKRTKIEDVIKFRKKWYQPCNSIIFVTLNKDMYSRCHKEIETIWGNLENNSKIELPGQIISKRSNDDGIYLFYAPSKSDDYKIVIGYDIPWEWYNYKTYALEYLTMLLTDGLGSALMVKLRSEEGMIYSIQSSVEINYYGKSKFSISVRTQKQYVERVIVYIIDVVSTLIISCEMFNRKEYRDIIKREYLKTQGYREHSSEVEERLLWKAPIKNIHEISEEVSKLKLEELKDIFSELLNSQPTIWYSGLKKLY